MSDELLTIDELDAATRRAANDARVTVTTVGASRLGRPIEMLSIGDGARNALVVGVPHPNEPIGAVTIERMIGLLLVDEQARRGYRWHFIKAIDPEGLRLNQGWLKRPRTVATYLENFFRPALHRQPETTFPLDIPEAHFAASTPENEAWQRAFALTRPELHASLHHCDFGGGFYSLSRALPAAIAPLEQALRDSQLGVHEMETEDAVMAAERWTPSIDRYPTVPELIANAKAAGASWAYPWTVGEMSPGYGEQLYGTFTIIPEVPMWDAPSLHDASPSGFSAPQQRAMLRSLSAGAREVALRHAEMFAATALAPDAQECLWALQEGLKMMPASGAPPVADAAAHGRILSRHDFATIHTRQAMFVLRTYALLHRLASLVLDEQPACRAAQQARDESGTALRREIAILETYTRFLPNPLERTCGLQMRAIFVCAEALVAGG